MTATVELTSGQEEYLLDVVVAEPSGCATAPGNEVRLRMLEPVRCTGEIVLDDLAPS